MGYQANEIWCGRVHGTEAYRISNTRPSGLMLVLVFQSRRPKKRAFYKADHPLRPRRLMFSPRRGPFLSDCSPCGREGNCVWTCVATTRNKEAVPTACVLRIMIERGIVPSSNDNRPSAAYIEYIGSEKSFRRQRRINLDLDFLSTRTRDHLMGSGPATGKSGDQVIRLG